MNTDDGISFGVANVNGIKLHYAKAGTGDKLVLLLHGFPEFWYSWRHQLAGLSDQYTVVAPDLRGYNLSDRPSNISDYKVDHLVQDVAGLIRHFDMGPAALVGHDWGAAIAWTFAARHPELLWKLAALQVPPMPVWKKNQTAKQFFASWYMFFFQLPYLPELIIGHNDFALLSNSLKETTAVPGIIADEDIAEYKKIWRQPGAMTAMLNYYRANLLGRLFSSGGEPQKITVPTLFIYGEKDTAVMPETVAGIENMIDGYYQEHRIPHAGHWVQQEVPDEVTQTLRRFLDDQTNV